jgi:hypothetical protein
MLQDRVDRVDECGVQVEPAERPRRVVVVHPPPIHLAVARVDELGVRRVAAGLDRRGRGHDLEDRARRVEAGGGAVQQRVRTLAVGADAGHLVEVPLDEVRVVRGRGVHRQHLPGPDVERHDRAAAAAERVLGGPLRTRDERQAQVVAFDRRALRLVDERLEDGREIRVLAGQVVVHRPLEAGAEARLGRVADDVGSESARGVLAEVEGAAGLLLLPVRGIGDPVAADLAALDRELGDLLDLVVLPVGEVARGPGLPVRRRDDERDDHANAGEREPCDLPVHVRPLAACMFARFETCSSSASRMKLATTLEPP